MDTLELVVANDEGGEASEVAEDVGWQDRDLVVAQVPESKSGSRS